MANDDNDIALKEHPKTGELVEEEWKEIEGYDGWYEISNYGRVRSWKRPGRGNKRSKEPKIRKLVPHHRSGELQVMLHMSGEEEMKTAHRLVAEYFVPNPDDKPEVNHKDGNRQNNFYKNLEWTTRAENMEHGYNTGLIDINGSKNGMSKLTESDIKKIKELREQGLYLNEIGEKFNISFQHVSKIVNNKRWRHL